MVPPGNMSSFDGINCWHLIRLNTDGTLDTGSQVDLQSYFANGITIDQQGSILMVGGFTFVNGAPCGRIVRLNPDGSTDETFDTGFGFNAQANVICVDQQGRTLGHRIFHLLRRRYRTWHHPPFAEWSHGSCIHTWIRA